MFSHLSSLIIGPPLLGTRRRALTSGHNCLLSITAPYSCLGLRTKSDPAASSFGSLSSERERQKERMFILVSHIPSCLAMGGLHLSDISNIMNDK